MRDNIYEAEQHEDNDMHAEASQTRDKDAAQALALEAWTSSVPNDGRQRTHQELPEIDPLKSTAGLLGSLDKGCFPDPDKQNKPHREQEVSPHFTPRDGQQSRSLVEELMKRLAHPQK